MKKKFTAWIARDESRILFVYTSKPEKDESLGVWYNPKDYGIGINKIDDFPQVKWEDDEPTKVELTIKICK